MLKNNTYIGRKIKRMKKIQEIKGKSIVKYFFNEV
jgi:hypothetical protein